MICGRAHRGWNRTSFTRVIGDLFCFLWSFQSKIICSDLAVFLAVVLENVVFGLVFRVFESSNSNLVQTVRAGSETSYKCTVQTWVLGTELREFVRVWKWSLGHVVKFNFFTGLFAGCLVCQPSCHGWKFGLFDLFDRVHVRPSSPHQFFDFQPLVKLALSHLFRFPLQEDFYVSWAGMEQWNLVDA